MRTIAYVDGYNFYFGCLKGTPYKWLDLVRLIEGIVRVQDPNSKLLIVKYFTAPILARAASHGQAATAAQHAYHRALDARGGIQIVNGWYSFEPAWLMVADRQPPSKQRRTRVWRFEEKESDVSLALHMYRDATRGECEQQVLVTNDSDLVPALQAIAHDVPTIRRGVIIPRRELSPGTSADNRRKPNGSLSALAHWSRSEIKDAELAAAQLPARVGTKKKPADKPGYW